METFVACSDVCYQPLSSPCVDPIEVLLPRISEPLQVKEKKTKHDPVIFLPAIRKQVCLFFNECKRMQIAERKSLGSELCVSLFRFLRVHQLSPAGGKARGGCYFRKSLAPWA